MPRLPLMRQHQRLQLKHPEPAIRGHSGTANTARFVGHVRAGTSRIKVEMAEAVTLARLHGVERLDWALGHAATFGRFDEGDLASILAAHPSGQPRSAGEGHSLQASTNAWEGFGR